MALTEYEFTRVALHLGYPVIKKAGTLQLGLRTAQNIENVLIISLNEVDEVAEPTIREILCECETVYKEQKAARRNNLTVSQVDGIKFRGPEQMAELEIQYRMWTARLADALASIKNPVSEHHQDLSGGIVTDSW